MIKNYDVKTKYLCWSPSKYNLFNNSHNFFAIAWDLLAHDDKYFSNIELIIKNIGVVKLVSVSILSMK